MPDVFSPEKRSAIMSRIRSKNTLPEVLVRGALRRLRLRFRAHPVNLPGKPDFVLPEFRVAILVHGCFWHGHDCRDGRRPGSNRLYWNPKLEANTARDQRHARALRRLGWSIVRIWACQIEKRDREGQEALLSSRLSRTSRFTRIDRSARDKP